MQPLRMLCLAAIMDAYYLHSNQAINYEKSHITFSPTAGPVI